MKDLESVVPSFRDQGGLDALSAWLEDEGQLLLLHDEQTMPSLAGTPEAHFVSCMALFDAAPETIREALDVMEAATEAVR